MHTIDLLRGQGIPAKTTFASVAIVMVTVVVPFIVAIVMLDRYLRIETVLEIRQQAIAKELATIDELADAVELKESKEKEKDIINIRLSEVSSCVDEYVQWSPVLETLVENMPGELIMNNLTAANKHVKETVVRNNDPNRPANVTVSKRTLALDISGIEPGDYEGIVGEYRDLLKSPDLLGPQLVDIDFSQKPGGTGDDKTVSYTMDFIFKSGS
jgi:hypothetical protein